MDVTADRVAQAMRVVARRDYLPPGVRGHAGDDAPVMIGHGSTNSQPRTVAAMLRLLDPRPGQRVLDVGSGSGWTTALLSWLTGPGGSVLGVELEPELVDMARTHLAAQHVPRVRVERRRPRRARLPCGGAVRRDPGVGRGPRTASGAARPARRPRPDGDPRGRGDAARRAARRHGPGQPAWALPLRPVALSRPQASCRPSSTRRVVEPGPNHRVRCGNGIVTPASSKAFLTASATSLRARHREAMSEACQ